MTQNRIEVEREYTQVWQHEAYCWYHPGIGCWWDGSAGKVTNNRHARSRYKTKAIAEKYSPHYNGYPSSKWELHRKSLGHTVATVHQTMDIKVNP